jgi:hypothetical protein
MSMKQGLREPKLRKEKETLQFEFITIEGSLREEEELKCVSDIFV